MFRRLLAAAAAMLCLHLPGQAAPKAKSPVASHLLPLRAGQVDAVSGELSLDLPLGPRLPGRIPLGFAWRYRNQFPTTANGSQHSDGSPLGGTLFPVVWCPLPADSHDLNPAVPATPSVTVVVEGEPWTFYGQAAPAQPHPDADVLTWLRARGVAGSALPASTADFQLFRVLPNTDGSRVLVCAQFAGAGLLAIVDGPLAIWTRDAQTSHFSNLWQDHVIVRQTAGRAGAPTAMEIVNARDESACLRLSIEEGQATRGFHFQSLPITVRVRNPFGLPEASAAGLCRQEERLAYTPYQAGHATQVYSGTWNWGFFPEHITHSASDGASTRTRLAWSDQDILQSITHPGDLRESFSWGRRCNFSARAFDPNTGYWTGYRPNMDTEGRRATESEEHAPNPELLGVTAITRTGEGLGDRTVIQVATPQGRYIGGRWNWNSSRLASSTTILRHGKASPEFGDPVRGLRLTHPEAGFAPEQGLDLEGYLFATRAILKAEAFTGRFDGEGVVADAPHQTTVHEGWTVESWANPRGLLVKGLPVTAVARKSTTTSTDLPGISTVTLSDRPDSFGPTRTVEKTGPLTRTATLTRHFDIGLGQMLTDSESRTLADASEPSLRLDGSAIDLGTTSYGHDRLGRLTSITVRRGEFVEKETRSYAEGLPLVVASRRNVTRDGVQVPANRDLEGVVVGSESVPDDSSYRWPSKVRELPDGRWTVFASRDALGREVDRIEPDGLSSHTEYDAWGNVALCFLKDRDGETVLTTETVTDPEGRFRRTTVTPKGGAALSTVTLFDSLGRQVSATHPDGSSQNTRYDGWGQRIAQSPVLRPGESGTGDARWSYDARGREEASWDPQGRKLSEVTCHPVLRGSHQGIRNGVWRTVRDAQGETRTEVHDLLGQKIALIDQLGQTSRYGYDLDGRLAFVTQGRQRRSFHYNRAGWLEARVEPEEGMTVFSEHNLLGVPRKVTRMGLDNSGRWSTTTTLGAWLEPRKQVAKSPEGTLTRTLNYDSRTHQLRERVEEQALGTLRETFSYDPLLRLAGKTVSDGSRTFEVGRRLDALGRVLSLSYPGADGAGRTVTTEYDKGGRPAKVALDGEARAGMAYGAGSAEGYADTLTYGNQVSTTSTWRKGELVNVSHGVRRSELPDNRQSSDLKWLAGGLLAARGADEFQYDALQRLSQASTAGLATDERLVQKFGYDAFGNRTRSEFSYQGERQPEEVMAWSAAYDGRNRLPGAVRGPGGDLATGAVYDELGRLTEVLAVPNNQNAHRAAWAYDPCGRVVKEVAAGEATSYLLDGEGLRFKRVRQDGAASYTVYGFQREPLATFEPAPVPANLWTGAAAATLTVPEGKWTSQAPAAQPCRPGEAFRGEAQGTVTGTSTGSAHVGMRFDSETETGLAFATSVDGIAQGSISPEPTRLACQGVAPEGATKVVFYVECGEAAPGAVAGFSGIRFHRPGATGLVPTRAMVYGFGQLLSEETKAGPVYVQSDQVGSPNLLSDADGQVVGQCRNLPFGERFGQSGVRSARRFTNHEDQPGSAIYMQARIYLPAYGRFAQVDPAHDQAKDDPETWNLYAYVGNNPVTHTDPDGRRAIPKEKDRELIKKISPSAQQRNWNVAHGFCSAGPAKGGNPSAKADGKPMPGAEPGTGSGRGGAAMEANAPDPSARDQHGRGAQADGAGQGPFSSGRIVNLTKDIATSDIQPSPGAITLVAHGGANRQDLIGASLGGPFYNVQETACIITAAGYKSGMEVVLLVCHGGAGKVQTVDGQITVTRQPFAQSLADALGGKVLASPNRLGPHKDSRGGFHLDELFNHGSRPAQLVPFSPGTQQPWSSLVPK